MNQTPTVPKIKQNDVMNTLSPRHGVLHFIDDNFESISIYNFFGLIHIHCNLCSKGPN